jgi:hypothetical protein
VDHRLVTRRDYPTAGLTFHWDSDICIHSGVCAADGTVLREVGRVAYLCRCGHSATKPFCDGTHNRVGFSDAPAPAS